MGYLTNGGSLEGGTMPFIREALDPEQARVVELRFFGGLTVEETASALGISASTVKREWAIAKGWLYRTLRGDAGV